MQALLEKESSAPGQRISSEIQEFGCRVDISFPFFIIDRGLTVVNVKAAPNAVPYATRGNTDGNRPVTTETNVGAVRLHASVPDMALSAVGPEIKQGADSELFNSIAARYDRLTRRLRDFPCRVAKAPETKQAG
jgi:hypothetical protein